MHALFGGFMSLGSRGTFFSLSFPYHCTSAFSSHLVGCVPRLFFLILSTTCLFHILSTLSGDPPQFITWRVVTSFPPSNLADTGLEILSLRRSSCRREFVCYLSAWGCVHLLSISSLGFICSCSGYVCLYICKIYIYIKKIKK